ncbi:DNA polymerase IV [Limibacter armeniacum]|uniref:DNA polymerase IV n=1 Tax=Limibacter armeniacum TaxID=466084 RepID=UPI002FE64E50
METLRKIIHIDMDAFYASVEQRDNPSLKGKPVAVGGSALRGVVAAASYEARAFGVRSAMPSSLAKRKCPELIFIKPRFEVYQKVSKHVRTIFHEYTDLVEPLSLDEAYLDVTENKKGLKSAINMAMQIRQRIKSELNLTASAGVSFNKFLAKTASDLNKPDGLAVILPGEEEKVLDQLAIEKFYGVGRVTAEKMRKLGIYRGRDLKMWPKSDLTHMFGKAGNYYFNIARGVDNRLVTPNRVRKSIGIENTFFDDLLTMEEVKNKLEQLSSKLWERLQKAGAHGKTLTLKIKYHDFEQITRSKTQLNNFQDQREIMEIANELLIEFGEEDFKIRLLGLSISNLNKEIEQKDYQLSIWEE